MDHYTKQDVLAALREFCKGFDTYALAAKALKVTESQLSQTRNGKKTVIPARILKKLGFTEKVVYVSTSKRPTVAPVKKVARRINRDAGTGELVTAAFAEAHPTTTVTETVDDNVIDVRSRD